MKLPSHLLIDNKVANYLLQTCKASDICLDSEIAINVDLEIVINYNLQSCKAHFCSQFLQLCTVQFRYDNLLIEHKIGTDTNNIHFICFIIINTKAR